MFAGIAPRTLLRAPQSTDAGRTRWTVDQRVAFLAFVHYLPVVGHLSNVRPVVVKSHVADQQHLAVVDTSREAAINFDTMRSVFGPLSEVTLGDVASSQREAILALELCPHSVFRLRRNDDSVPWSRRQSFTSCWSTPEKYGPGAIVTGYRSDVVREFVAVLAIDRNLLAVGHSFARSVILSQTMFHFRYDTRCETFRKRIGPTAVLLARGERGDALELHALLTAEVDDRAQIGGRAFQPAVVQRTRIAAVDF